MIIPFLRYTVINFFVFLKNLFFAPFSKLSRHRLSNAYDKLIYPYYGKQYVDLSMLLQNNELEVNLSPVKSKEHNTSAFELLSICSILKDRYCNNIFEIGTYDGRTTRAMSMNLLNEHGKIYTLNLPENTNKVFMATNVLDINLSHKVVSGERFLNTPNQKYIEQLLGDSALFDYSPYFGKMDMVFIDGAHSEKYVETDTMNALKLVRKSGGILIWHDAHLYGVVKFILPWIKLNRLPLFFIKDTSLAIACVRDGNIVDWEYMSSV